MSAIFDGMKKRDIENVRNMARYTSRIWLDLMNIGIDRTSAHRSKSEMTMILRLLSRSTHAPAIGPIRNTGMMVNEMSFASAISEPGFRW